MILWILVTISFLRYLLLQGVTRVSVKSDETIKQGVIEKMPSSTLVPGLSSKLLQVSPARSLVTTLEGTPIKFTC